MQIDGHRCKRRANTGERYVDVDVWGLERARARARRVACLLLKCLHRPGRSVGRRNTPDIADFSSTTAGNPRPFTKISVSECYSLSLFSFFLPPSLLLHGAYESRTSFFSFFFDLR